MNPHLSSNLISHTSHPFGGVVDENAPLGILIYCTTTLLLCIFTSHRPHPPLGISISHTSPPNIVLASSSLHHLSKAPLIYSSQILRLLVLILAPHHSSHILRILIPILLYDNPTSYEDQTCFEILSVDRNLIYFLVHLAIFQLSS